MTIGKMLLGEFDQEMANTRKAFSRIPSDKREWRPHPKSMTMIGIATHIANMVGWGAMTMQTESYNYDPATGAQNTPAESREDLLSKFDKNVAEFRQELESASDEAMMAPWSFLASGQPVFTMPRIATIRGMILNHIIHHRGQLTLYFRMNDIPVPALYGPSGDEN